MQPVRAAQVNCPVRLYRTGGIHKRPHPPDNGAQPVKNRLANEKMPDIQLNHFSNRSDRANIGEGEPMPGMHLKPQRMGKPRTVHQPRQFHGIAGLAAMGIGPGVQLHDIGPKPGGGFELMRIGIHEQ